MAASWRASGGKASRRSRRSGSRAWKAGELEIYTRNELKRWPRWQEASVKSASWPCETAGRCISHWFSTHTHHLENCGHVMQLSHSCCDSSTNLMPYTCSSVLLWLSSQIPLHVSRTLKSNPSEPAGRSSLEERFSWEDCKTPRRLNDAREVARV